MFGVVPDWSVVISISGSSSVMSILFSVVTSPSYKPSLHIDIDRLKKKKNQRRPLNFNLIQNLQEILILLSWKLCLMRKLKSFNMQFSAYSLRQVGTAQDQTTAGEKWILQGRARCEVCRNKVCPLILCKLRWGGKKGSETLELAVFPLL